MLCVWRFFFHFAICLKLDFLLNDLCTFDQGQSASGEVESLKNHIAELEAEKGHLQLKVVELEEQMAQMKTDQKWEAEEQLESQKVDAQKKIDEALQRESAVTEQLQEVNTWL